MRTLFLSLLLILGKTCLTAQTAAGSFDIRYPLQYFGNGSEKNQFAELQNGKILLFRSEAEEDGKHFIRLWCIDKIGSVQWDRKLLVGENPASWSSASLKSIGNEAILVYSHAVQAKKNELRMIRIDENGLILTAHRLSIPNDPTIQNIRSIVHNQELIVSFDVLASGSGQSAVFGKIPLTAISSATWFHTTELQQSITLYQDGNNGIRFLATKDSTAVDFSLDQTGTFQAIRFPSRFLPESAISFNGSRYYTGSLTEGIYVNAMLHKIENNQPSGWAKLLDVYGPIYHGSTSSGLEISNGKILISGYGSVPRVVTFLSVFEEDGSVLKTEIFGFHCFNYNRGDLFKHSSGSIYFLELAGIWPGNQFTTVVGQVDTSNFTSCDSEPFDYPYTDTVIQNTATTVSFTSENYPLTTLSVDFISDSFPREISCHTSLSLNEQHAISFETYPNPFVESFIIRSDIPSELAIHCYDLMGKEITVGQKIMDAQHVRITPPDGFSGALVCRVQTTSGNTQTMLVHAM